MLPLLATLLPAVVGVIDKFIPDTASRDKAKAEAQMVLLQTLAASDLAQQEVNKVEAANSSVFVSGWRPACGWICALALGYQYLVIPFATWGFAMAHMIVPAFPLLDDNLWQLLFGMLGMGGLRTFERIKGVDRKRL